MSTVYKTFDGKEVSLYIWDNVKNPKGIVKIIHGMCEHSSRYEEFANCLNKNGYICVSNDLRGHGPSCKTLGYDDGDMWTNNIIDQITITKDLKEKYPNLPIILLGHSYGSFLTQQLLAYNVDVSKIILSGSSIRDNKQGFQKMYDMACQYNPKDLANELSSLTFNSYNKGFESDGDYGWLSRNIPSNKKYIDDPLCGFMCTNNFYKTFFGGLIKLSDCSLLSSVCKKRPIYIFSGDKDPVGQMGEGVKKLYELYKTYGLNVSMKLYKDGRHEMLNETNKDEVYEDILKFINI